MKKRFFKLTGERLRDLRKQAGFKSYYAFAYEKGFERSTVLRAEQGKNVSLDKLYDILLALKVSPEEFFKGIK